MKVAYFLDTPHGVGGAGNTLIMQARLMSDLHEIVVVIPVDEQGEENPDYAYRCEKYNLRHCGLLYKTSFNFYNVDLLDALDSLSEIRRFLVEEKIELIHSVQLNIAVELASRELGLPHLMDIYQLERCEFKIKYGDFYPYFHLCDSYKYSEIWGEEMGIESRVMRFSAISESIVKKQKYAGNNYTVLMLGSVCERKNQLAAIQAVEKILENVNLKLIIAGDDSSEYAGRCKCYIAEHHLEEYVQMCGFENDVEKLLNKSDWFLCTSLDESFPSSIIEAVAYDLTIISTPVAGVPEVFHDKENGFISRGFSVEEIKKSLLDCNEYSVNGKITSIHREQWRTWEENFSLEYNREQLNEYYDEIVTKNKTLIRKIDYDFIDKICQFQKEIERKTNDGDRYKSRCLYYSYVLPKLEGQSIYIWGAGQFGKQAYDLISTMCTESEILGFVDTFKTGVYCGKNIVKPNEITFQNGVCVLVAFGGNHEMAIRHLERLGFTFNSNIWIVP